MVIDHINVIWLDGSAKWMFYLGRAAFPLFCYALAVRFMLRDDTDTAVRYGIAHYGTRIFLIAILTEPFSQVTRGPETLNILFTLSFAAVMIALSLRLRDLWVYLLALAAAGMMYFTTYIEFGTAGVMLPAVLLMVMRGKKTAVPFLLLLLFALNASHGIGAERVDWRGDWPQLLTAFAVASLLPLMLLRAATRLPQDRRLLHKYALHIFYPAHLIVLWLLKKLAA